MASVGINALLFAVLATGHAAISFALINRIHARSLTRGLRRFRRLGDIVLIVLLPALFVALVGFAGPGLLRGGSWQALPWPLSAYLALCAAVALSLPGVAWYRHRHNRPPLAQLSNHSQRLDIAGRLGYRPIGKGRHALLTHIPANQCFELEVSDKEYRLPRLPAEWDGLSILHLSDLHFVGSPDLPYFEEVIEVAKSIPADLVVFTGDLLDRQSLVSWIPTTLGRLSAPLGCWYVLGNHDSYLREPDKIRRELGRLGWRGLAGDVQMLVHRGRKLALCGSERPWMGRRPEMTGVPLDAFRLFVSHTPDTLPWARRHQIDLMLAGHNHGGQVRLPIFGAVHAPSAFGTRYASGAFWEDPTLLYVSRGISGREPWRWNCPPELTRLILRSPASGGC